MDCFVYSFIMFLILKIIFNSSIIFHYMIAAYIIYLLYYCWLFSSFQVFTLNNVKINILCTGHCIHY